MAAAMTISTATAAKASMTVAESIRMHQELSFPIGADELLVTLTLITGPQ